MYVGSLLRDDDREFLPDLRFSCFLESIRYSGVSAVAEPQLPLRLFDPRTSADVRVTWVAGKRLAAVDLPHFGSHQHELNGSRQLRDVLGPERVQGRIRWLRLSDEEGVAAESTGDFTWYDAREKHATRTEYRLYYDDRSLLAEAEPGDLLILARLDSEAPALLLAFVVPRGSSLESQLCWLFGLDPEQLDQFSVPDPAVLASRSERLEAAGVVDTLGLLWRAPYPAATDLDLVRRRFGDAFPTTADMSEFAREQAPADATQDPDRALLGWLEREEQLFRALEEFIVEQKLSEGFAGVDDFIGFSLSVQNRRKSRMGFAFENHLRAVFDACDVSYSHQAATEHRARPDFLFPGIEAYRDPAFPADRLHMLGAKSTCKDRWRQVLSEAERIQEKHLCTLEPGISVAQTDEMRAHDVRLVLPGRVSDSYVREQCAWALNLGQFIEVVS